MVQTAITFIVLVDLKESVMSVNSSLVSIQTLGSVERRLRRRIERGRRSPPPADPRLICICVRHPFIRRKKKDGSISVFSSDFLKPIRRDNYVPSGEKIFYFASSAASGRRSEGEEEEEEEEFMVIPSFLPLPPWLRPQAASGQQSLQLPLILTKMSRN